MAFFAQFDTAFALGAGGLPQQNRPEGMLATEFSEAPAAGPSGRSRPRGSSLCPLTDYNEGCGTSTTGRESRHKGEDPGSG
jgi:hypothetical protein